MQGDSGRPVRTQGSETEKGRKPVQCVAISRLLLWVPGIPSCLGPLGDRMVMP